MNKTYKRLMKEIEDNPKLKTNHEHRRKIRDSLVGDVRQMAEIEALNDQEISEKLKVVGPGVVNKIRQEHDIMNGQDVKDAHRDVKIVDTWNAKHSVMKVAEAIGCTMNTAKGHLKRLEYDGKVELNDSIREKFKTNKPRQFQLSDKPESRERGWKKAQAKNKRRHGAQIRVSEQDAQEYLSRLFWSRVGPVMEGDAAYCVRRQVEKLRAKRNARRRAIVT